MVLGPTDFSNQRLEFFVAVIGEVELPHVPEILRRKSLDTRKRRIETDTIFNRSYRH